MGDTILNDVNLPWLLLQRKDFAQAHTLFRERYVSERSPGRRRGLGEALLWSGEYELALIHFKDSIARDQRFKISSEEDFAFLGAAEWCLGSYESAVKIWKSGVKAPGSIGGGRTHCPLLLLLASILEPGLFQKASAEEMLVQRLRNPRTQFWPATLAWYVVGRIDEKVLEDSWTWYVAQGIRGMTVSSKWITEFYRSLILLGSEKITKTEFRLRMRSLVDESQIELCDLEDFIQVTWNPELYIARHEADSSQ